MTKDVRLTEPQIQERLRALPGWRLADGMLRRTYKTDGWPTTLMLVNAIGFYAEAADHHPDLEVHWGSVSVALSTHSAGGVTAKDCELAELIEQAALWRPGSASVLRGTPKGFVQRE
ncbi:MAG TPA: 4a-hydroxytetrahydrobiopterin dehydratase [Gemmatimonadales bacterium]|nr:4a-hydroxytetrahydrobiopterin dehydratase [Gemmatimonadales bacterium]